MEQALKRKGHKAVAIHGDMTQEARLKALEGFKNGTTPMMIGKYALPWALRREPHNVEWSLHGVLSLQS